MSKLEIESPFCDKVGKYVCYFTLAIKRLANPRDGYSYFLWMVGEMFLNYMVYVNLLLFDIDN